jgi:diaminopimelate epimerase
VSIRGDREVAMRVHERGVGETRSCGTGACAVAVAVAHLGGLSAGEWTVDVPGGRLLVALDRGRLQLTGPAVVVGAGVLDEKWLAAVAGGP